METQGWRGGGGGWGGAEGDDRGSGRQREREDIVRQLHQHHRSQAGGDEEWKERAEEEVEKCIKIC